MNTGHLLYNCQSNGHIDAKGLVAIVQQMIYNSTVKHLLFIACPKDIYIRKGTSTVCTDRSTENLELSSTIVPVKMDI